MDSVSDIGLESVSVIGLKSVSDIGLKSVSDIGLKSVSDIGLESVSDIGLKSVSDIGLESVLNPLQEHIQSSASRRRDVQLERVRFGRLGLLFLKEINWGIEECSLKINLSFKQESRYRSEPKFKSCNPVFMQILQTESKTKALDLQAHF